MPSYLHSIPDVRLGEFDMGGVLYHANYYHLYEAAREAFLRHEKNPYPGFVQRREHLAIVEARQEFIKPIRYGEPLTVHLSFSDVRKTSFVCRYLIGGEGGVKGPLSARDALLHRGLTRHVLVKDTGGGFRPTPLPQDLITVLQNYRHED